MEEMGREVEIKKWMEKLPTTSRIEVFNHDESFGFVIPFSVAGFGFGEITLSVDKDTGQPYCDLESMPPELCGEIVERTIGSTVEDAEQNWNELMERMEGK